MDFQIWNTDKILFEKKISEAYDGILMRLFCRSLNSHLFDITFAASSTSYTYLKISSVRQSNSPDS